MLTCPTLGAARADSDAMSTRMTVLTGAWSPDLGLLMEAGASVANASAEELNWLICLDDAASSSVAVPDVRDAAIAAVAGSRVAVEVEALPFRAGAGGTRTVALAKVRTDWVAVLDADDLLTEGSLDVQLSLLDADPAARWAIGAGETLNPDGTRVLWPHSLPAQVPAGLVARCARLTGALPSIPIAGVWSSDLIRSLGGWQGLPRDEDTSLKLAATSVVDGCATPSSVYVYRRGVAGQATASAKFAEAGSLCRAVALDRLFGLVRAGDAPADLLYGDWSAFLAG